VGYVISLVCTLTNGHWHEEEHNAYGDCDTDIRSNADDVLSGKFCSTGLAKYSMLNQKSCVAIIDMAVGSDDRNSADICFVTQ